MYQLGVLIGAVASGFGWFLSPSQADFAGKYIRLQTVFYG